MAKEHEIAVLDIDKEDLRKRLGKLGAKKVGDFNFKRIEFLLNGEGAGRHAWGRVRSDGKKTTIAVKEIEGDDGFTPMNEYEIEASDFDDAARIMAKVANSNLIVYFENSREEYKLGEIKITIDKWPEIPEFAEIEGPTMDEVKRLYRELGLEGKPAGNFNIRKIYERYGLVYENVVKKNDGKLRKLLDG